MDNSGLAVEIRHEGAFESGEMAQHVAAFLVKAPRHPQGFMTMQTAVRAQKAERGPALVQVGRCGIFKAGDIMAPVAIAGLAEGQAAAQALRHGEIGRLIVAAPVDGEHLRADSCRAGKNAGLLRTLLFYKQLIDGFVVEIGIVVVHLARVGAVVVDDISRQTLAEVGFDAVNTHVQNFTQTAGVPFGSSRIGEVDICCAAHPHVCLPDIAVFILDEVSALHALGKQPGDLADVGVNPDADLYAAFVNFVDHMARIAEAVTPDEVAVVEIIHPAGIKVVDTERNPVFMHLVDGGQRRLFCGIRNPAR